MRFKPERRCVCVGCVEHRSPPRHLAKREAFAVDRDQRGVRGNHEGPHDYATDAWEPYDPTDEACWCGACLCCVAEQVTPESPPFRPKVLDAFAASGFVRRRRQRAMLGALLDSLPDSPPTPSTSDD